MMGGFFAPTATTSWTAPDVVATEEEGLGAAINDPGVTTTAMSSRGRRNLCPDGVCSVVLRTRIKCK